MKRMKKRKKENEGFNIWKSTVDMLAVLVFIFILLVALLGLYLLNDYTSYHKKETIISREYSDNRGAGKKTDPVPKSSEDRREESSSEKMTENEESGNQTAEEKIRSGNKADDKQKAAVLVQMIDAETEKTIPVEGIVFELYKADGTRQILNTYYPDKISYQEFATTDGGNFYLPEKIAQGNYKFHEKMQIEGYEYAEDKSFSLRRPYDWTEPYLVKIPLLPSKNVICVQMNDRESGDAVGNGHFLVVAQNDIRTLDGTIRYRKGESVGEIVCDENGYGESDELYLGVYCLREKEIPEYYAGIAEDLEIGVERKTGQRQQIHAVETEKTKICLNLVDERYPQMTIEGAEFQVSTSSDASPVSSSETLQTDELGNIILTDLEKDTTYYLRQVTAPDDYCLDTEEYELTVDEQGRIRGSARADLALTNRMIRVTIQAVDKIFKKGSSGVHFSLYDENDRLVDSWSEDGSGRMFTELVKGTYYLERDGNSAKRYELAIKDQADIQEWKIPVFTWKSVIAIAGTGLAFAGILLAGYLILRKLFYRY